jgi:hypothetical protein
MGEFSDLILKEIFFTIFTAKGGQAITSIAIEIISLLVRFKFFLSSQRLVTKVRFKK